MDPKELSEYEDMMIGIATSEAVQFGRDISQIVTRHRGRRRGPMNRYECQVYCEKLLIRVHNLLEPTAHDLLEPASRGGERNLTTLLNEIEKNPSSFLTLHKAASRGTRRAPPAPPRPASPGWPAGTPSCPAPVLVCLWFSPPNRGNRFPRFVRRLPSRFSRLAGGADHPTQNVHRRARPGHAALPECSLRYSDGVTPMCFLNCREK